MEPAQRSLPVVEGEVALHERRAQTALLEFTTTERPSEEAAILWHVMKHFRHHGHREFLIALGYRGEVVKRYFLDEQMLAGDMTVDLAAGRVEQRPVSREDWIVHLVDTGELTNTGGRIKRLA